MKFGIESMNELMEKMVAKKLPHVHNVIIGDNSSGKSLLLKLFIENRKHCEPIYFIDAVNRSFDITKISRLTEKPEYKSTILETRMQEQYFNLLDSFNCYGTLTERVEMVYGLYEEKIQELFFKLTGNRFHLMHGELLGTVDFGNGQGLLSSGYQAIIRILTELVYYHDKVIVEPGKEAWVVIDELDEFLSPRYAASILEFLKQEFSWAKWLVTTHSCDLVKCTTDANLILLEDGSCEVMDIDDYDSMSEVQIVFERAFGKHMVNQDGTENILRRLLNNKMNQAWGDKDDECLRKLQEMKLSASQKIILKQIQEW